MLGAQKPWKEDSRPVPFGVSKEEGHRPKHHGKKHLT